MHSPHILHDFDQAISSLHARDKELDRMYKEATATFGTRIEQGNGRSQDCLHHASDREL